MQFHVGQAALRGDIARYARRFDLLELRAEPGKLPKSKQLREWASRVPPGFVFSIMLPRAVSALEPGVAFESGLAYALQAADALSAKWLVLQTPPTVTPSARARGRLAELVERLRGSERRIAWEARGLWEDEETEKVGEELGLHVARDLSRQQPPPDPVVYCRLLALGEAMRVRSSAVERVFENLLDCDEAFVVMEGDGAVGAAQLFRQLTGELDAAELDDDAGEDDEESADDGEDDESELDNEETD